MMRLRALCAAAAAVAGAAAVAAPAPALGAGAVAVRLAPYPVVPSGPLGQSVLPGALDDDEVITARLRPDGGVQSMSDQVTLKVTGGGDYVLDLPGRAASVADSGGDSPPSLQDGRVEFLGHVEGSELLAADAQLPGTDESMLPVRVALTYESGGRPVDPVSLLGSSASITMQVSVTNATGADTQLITGRPTTAGRGTLLRAAAALRGAVQDYSPEVPLQALHPLPESFSIAPPPAMGTVTVFVPLSVSVQVTLPRSARVSSELSPHLARSAKGDVVRWTDVLADSLGSPSRLAHEVAFSEQSFAVPGVEVSVDPAPPSSAAVSAAETMLASGDYAGAERNIEYDAAALHHIADLVAPIGRPGPGPQRLRYQLVLDSRSARVRSAGAPPRGPYPLPLALSCLGLLALGLNGWWLWSRN
jgi:hypothetical protein